MEVFSEHARNRCAQRHIPQHDIDTVMSMGRKIHRTG